MYQTEVVQKIKTHILCSINVFQKLCRLWDNVEKYGTARQDTDDNIIQRFACCITKARDTPRILVYNSCRFSTVKMITTKVMLYVNCLSCVIYFRCNGSWHMRDLRFLGGDYIVDSLGCDTLQLLYLTTLSIAQNIWRLTVAVMTK
jgi:hypothetical protein